ncbi:hypothetical protein OPQ81_008558 [Rhizoctonia solani]|nr:hypothetical protein OPQ81_008558 [Rhizoctonia solani]
MFGYASLLGNVLPPIPYISLGRSHRWQTKHSTFEAVGADIYGTASIFPPAAYFTLADPVAIKQVSYPRNSFTKRTENYKILKGFGSNLLVTEGEEWKRQRRIAAPAFSDKNNRLVWETAKGFVKQMISTWEDGKPTTVYDVSEDLALPLSLCVIAKAGFGQDISWNGHVASSGNELTFQEALSTASKTMHLPLLLPNWAWSLKKSWRDAKQAHDELRRYLHEMIRSRRELKDQQVQAFLDQKHDLFNQLIYARDADDMLTEDELIVVYETLRLYPMVSVMPKEATADTAIMVGFPANPRSIQIPTSTEIHVFSTGLHYNPNYWENPNDFDPERFMDPHWNRDAFIAFSLGPRACIGRRFAETTLVADVVTLISKYKVSIDESRFKYVDGETILERRARLINLEERLTLSPAPISLVFSPRD